jgi:enoyl-CoA hydratase/carnithine racemase
MGVRIEERGSAHVVLLDWPERRNAIGPIAACELAEALDAAGSAAASGVVLTGVGAFCAGGDLPALLDMAERAGQAAVADSIYTDIHAVLRAIRRAPVPVVAAVDGPAVGLGFDLALLCDMCFVGPDGWLQQGWASVGLVHGTGGNAVLAGAAPGIAWRLIAEQARLDGPAAAALGLAEAADGSALDAALARVQRLAGMPRRTLEIYTALHRRLRWPDSAFLAACVEANAELIVSDEFRSAAALKLAR